MSKAESAIADAAVTGPPAASRRFGSYVLREVLGRSSRTMAWLGRDSRGRDVALLLPRTALTDPAEIARRVDDMRHAARISHPRILPVLDCGAVDGWPYVACVIPEGTRAGIDFASLRGIPPVESARLCSEWLEGLAYAHEGGHAHGDPGFHTVFTDAQGRAGVWGFGVAGEPSRDEQVHDVLAGGLLLHAMLAGTPALDEPDLPNAARRAAHEVVRLPWEVPLPVPEALRAIVNRAADRHANRRYLSARSLLRALSGWLQAQADQDQGSLALLADRLGALGHLPAQPMLAQRVSKLSQMEGQRIDELADIVLEDPALSIELLRVINSAHFGAQGTRLATEGVMTVRRVIQLIGVAGVRRAAAGLRSWPGPLDPEAEHALREATLRARRAGHLAEFLAPGGLDAEACLMAAQLHHLGRLVMRYHFHEEADQVARLMLPASAPTPEQAAPGMGEDAASLAVLGVTPASLAEAVMSNFRVSEALQRVARPLPPDQPVRTPTDVEGWIRVVASCANETLDAILAPTTQQAVKALGHVAARYSKPLDVTPGSLRDALERADSRLRGRFAISPAGVS